MNDLTAEALDIAQLYVELGFSMEQTAERTGLSTQDISNILSQPAAKNYVTQVYLDTGYRNKAKIGKLLDRIIENKLEEALESDMFTKYDLVDLLKFAHKVRMDEAKLNAPNTQVNIANFGNTHYSELVQKLLSGKKN